MPETVKAPYKGLDWDEFIVIQSSDQPCPVEFKLLRSLAEEFPLLAGMMSDAGEETVIPIPNVDGRTLEYVLQYMEYHHHNKAEPIEKPLKGKIENYICEWDKAFLFTDLIKDGDEKQHSLLIDVINAANFLDLKDLLDLCCSAQASMVNGKTTEQIRELFGIVNDFTPEEEERMREEAKWCEE